MLFVQAQMLADMATEIEAASLLVYKAASEADTGVKTGEGKQARDGTIFGITGTGDVTGRDSDSESRSTNNLRIPERM